MFHHLPMIDVLPEERELREWTDPAYVGRHYGEMRERAPGAIAQAITILAAPESLPAMFHCSAGKDRTGVLAALLLGALGVPDETIVADYSLSRDAMERMLVWLQERAPDPETLARFAPAIRCRGTRHDGSVPRRLARAVRHVRRLLRVARPRRHGRDAARDLARAVALSRSARPTRNTRQDELEELAVEVFAVGFEEHRLVEAVGRGVHDRRHLARQGCSA